MLNLKGNSPEFLSRIEATRNSRISCITLQEASSGKILSPVEQKIFMNQEKGKLDELDLKLDYIYEEGEVNMIISPGNCSGSTRFIHRKKIIDVIVEPKIGRADLFSMLQFINSEASLSNEESTSYIDTGDPSIQIINAVVSNINIFLKKNRITDFIFVHNQGTSSPKGRLNILEYIRRQIPNLRLDKMPCTYTERNIDTLDNRILKFTLKLASRMLSRYTNKLSGEIQRKIARGNSELIDVRNQIFTEKSILNVRYNSINKKFKPIHQLCLLLIKSSTISLIPGKKIEFSSFSLYMPGIYESYVRKIFYTAAANLGVSTVNQLKFEIDGFEKKVELDGLLNSSDKIVIECKYKIIENEISKKLLYNRVEHDDIYQSVAYANHQKIKAKTVLIVYPVIDSSKSGIVEFTETKSFSSYNDKLTIKVIGINLKMNAANLISDVQNLFNKLLFKL